MYTFKDIFDQYKALPDSVKADFFGPSKFINHKGLNDAGFHIYRTIKSRVDYVLRLKNKESALANEFLNNGMLILEGIVGPDDFKTGTFVPNGKLIDIVRELGFTTAIKLRHKRYVHHTNDPQYHSHVDTFHPSIKIWIYNQDIDMEHGPFHYSLGSNRVTQDKIKWLETTTNYIIDKGFKETDPLYDYGSFRVADHNPEPASLSKYQPAIGEKYTVLIGDTTGFHYRSKATPGTVRDTFYMLPERVGVFTDFNENTNPDLEQEIYYDIMRNDIKF